MNSHTQNQSKNKFGMADLPEAIFIGALAAKLISRFLPTGVGDVLYKCSLFTGGLALLAWGAVWLCTTLKNKKLQAAE